MLRIEQGVSSPDGTVIQAGYIVTGPNDARNWTLTGTVELSIKGNGSSWRYETVQVGLLIPGIGDKLVRLQQWAPFLTLQGLSNDKTAVNAGWLLDKMEILDPQAACARIEFQCQIGVRDIDGYVLRLGYLIHAIGGLVPAPDIV